MADPVYYFVGGEDIDFVSGDGYLLPYFVLTTNGVRPVYARGVLARNSAQPARSKQFSSGMISSCWLSWYESYSSSSVADHKGPGLASFATGNGVFFGSYNGYQRIFKRISGVYTSIYDGIYYGTRQRMDVNIINFGASTDILVYKEKALLVSLLAQDLSLVSAGIDCVILGHSNNRDYSISEIVCSDTETLHIKGVKTRIPISAGETNDMTGTYADVDDAAVDTSTNLTADTDGDEAQFVGTAMPTVEQVGGDYKIGHRKIVAYASRTFDASVDTIHLGEHVAGGVSDYDAGQLLVPGYTSYERHIPGSISKEDAAPKQLAVKLTTAV